MGKLFVVGTPIGNLEDITLRAIETMKSADVIACEDTRHTMNILTRYAIPKKRMIACHSKNEAESAAGIVKLIAEGNTVAYVSDAGTPGVSDPGARVAEAVREAGFDVVPIPGPSALTTLISAAGYVGKTVTFEGFLSPKAGKRASRIAELLTRNEAFVIYESPFRIVKTLSEVAKAAPDARVCVGREMTKIHEEYVVGTAAEVLEKLSARSSQKGEFALLVRPVSSEVLATDAEEDEDDYDTEA